MNVFLLSSAIILLICYLLYLSRRRDFNLLRTPPITNNLPRRKYDLALKELNEFKKHAPPKTRHKQIEHNSQIYYLERRLEQILVETEQEQKSYYLANKEREIAWRDYRDFFHSLNLLEKFVFPNKIREIILLRNLYLEAEKKVELETGKFNAQNRIRHHEETAKLEREIEIEEKTALETGKDIHEAFAEIDSDDNAIKEDNAITEAEDLSGDPVPTPERKISTEQETATPVQDHFGQGDIRERYPDFNGLAYIDESLSLEELELPALLDANFDNSYFVSVLFKGRHQYKDCSFQAADFSYSIWQRSEAPHRILSCDFTGAKLSFAAFDYIAFYNCRFIRTDFQETRFNTAKFVKCTVQDCILTGVDFSQAVMSSDMLESIDFSDCKAPPKNYIPKKDLSEDPAPPLPPEDPLE